MSTFCEDQFLKNTCCLLLGLIFSWEKISTFVRFFKTNLRKEIV